MAEVQSVETLLRFARATGAKVGIVHITVPESCRLVRQAKAEGVDVVAETCFNILTIIMDISINMVPTLNAIRRCVPVRIWRAYGNICSMVPSP